MIEIVLSVYVLERYAPVARGQIHSGADYDNKNRLPRFWWYFFSGFNGRRRRNRAAVSDQTGPLHVPFPAGGSTDVGARVVAEYLSRFVWPAVYIEKICANGAIGVSRSQSNAARLLDSRYRRHGGEHPHVFRLRYPTKDLCPIIQLSRQPSCWLRGRGAGVMKRLLRSRRTARYAAAYGRHMVCRTPSDLKHEQVPYRRRRWS